MRKRLASWVRGHSRLVSSTVAGRGRTIADCGCFGCLVTISDDEDQYDRRGADHVSLVQRGDVSLIGLGRDFLVNGVGECV